MQRGLDERPGEVVGRAWRHVALRLGALRARWVVPASRSQASQGPSRGRGPAGAREGWQGAAGDSGTAGHCAGASGPAGGRVCFAAPGPRGSSQRWVQTLSGSRLSLVLRSGGGVRRPPPGGAAFLCPAGGHFWLDCVLLVEGAC